MTNRLNRLERQLGKPGPCPACRDRRGRAVLITVEKQADGTMRDLKPRPPVCERCGEIPEQIIELCEQVVTVQDRRAAVDAVREG
jgi:hypothetical protein